MFRTAAFAMAATALIFFCAPAVAGSFMSSRAAWDKLEPDEKSGYAMGVFDGRYILYSGQSVAIDATVLGTNRCVRDAQITSQNMVKIIDEGYARDVAKWTEPPFAILLQELGKMCRASVNEQRAKGGLPSLPAQ